MYSILPRMTPKWQPNDPNSTLWFWSSTISHYLGAIRTILGEERGETSPKLLIWITYVAWFLNFNSHNLAKFCPISPSSTSFENYKAWQTFLDHFWKPKLPNKTFYPQLSRLNAIGEPKCKAQTFIEIQVVYDFVFVIDWGKLCSIYPNFILQMFIKTRPAKRKRLITFS